MSTMIPYIANNEQGIPILHVDGKPFLMLGGELHNSSSSSLEYMEEQVWPYLRELHMNTVLAAVAWEDLEPQEGVFDYTLIEGLLAQARREHMKLVFLWFGLWKNGGSQYVPGWVKKDRRRFFHAEGGEYELFPTISPFCREAVEKDKEAFCHLMNYLAEHDQEHTVIMVQIENEMGVWGPDRDYCAAAETEFVKQIPEEVAKLYGKNGTWQEAFGIDAGEMFMVYYYASAIERIACAGKKFLPLPMYVNAWLKQHPSRPGRYPFGGPVHTMIPMWQLKAPSISMCAPDIYVTEFGQVCKEYSTNGHAP